MHHLDLGRQAIALLTDFGEGSVYAGLMKGVIAGIAPGTPVIDLCHAVEPQAVGEAAFLLERSRRYLPAGTVFAAVVDPGVGTDRSIVCVEAAGQAFLAPDNGLLGPILDAFPDGLRAFRVAERRFFLADVSATFHGRDVFAPVAARLAAGEVGPEALGPAVEPGALSRLRRPAAIPCAPSGVEGWTGAGRGVAVAAEVAHVDRFGNLVTDFERDRAQRIERVVLPGGREVTELARTYGDVAEGTLLAYFGSFDTLEVGVRGGSAARLLGLGRGAALTVFHTHARADR